MMHKIVEQADRLMELAMPLIGRLSDDTSDYIPEKALEACADVVELAHYLYEIAMMKKKMYPHDDDYRMEGDPNPTNPPKPRY